MAARPLETGFFDSGRYLSANPSVRADALDLTLASASSIARVNVIWRDVAPSEPATPEDPDDPAYQWERLDAFVNDALARGIRPLLSVRSAPTWAEGPERPAWAPEGTWQPSPAALRSFATALAKRFPEVDDFQAWNEANLSVYLTPQWRGRQLVAARHYRRMLRSFYEGVKAAGAENRVVSVGLGPYGDQVGSVSLRVARTRPLAFWREVFCLRGRVKLRPARKCADKAKFDVFAYHAINTSGGPRRSALHPDDASTPDLQNAVRILRAAERHGQIGGSRKRHPVWMTEMWWESKPPDPIGVPLRKHARWLTEALYILWKQGARVAINLQVRDAAFDGQPGRHNLQAGLAFAENFREGARKPAFRAWRFPFLPQKRSKRRVLGWGRAPVGGVLVIERQRGKGWRRVRRARVRAGQVFRVRLRVAGRPKLRARIGQEVSLAWKP